MYPLMAKHLSTRRFCMPAIILAPRSPFQGHFPSERLPEYISEQGEFQKVIIVKVVLRWNGVY